MSDIRLFWFMPTHGDGRYLGNESEQRASNYKYYKQIAIALDTLGFSGVLIPTGRMFEEPWVVGTVLSAVTQRLKLLVAVRPGIVCPTYAARQTVALDRASDGRLLLNIVVGGNPLELKGDGIFSSALERYEQAFEFMHIYTSLLRGEKLSYKGRYYTVEGAELDFESIQKPFPPIYSAGSSTSGRDLAAQYADEYLTWGDPLEVVGRSIRAMDIKALENNRH